MAKPAQKRVLGPCRPGPAHRGDADKPMQLACQHEVLAQLKLSCWDERCLEWWLGREVLVTFMSLAGSTAKYSSNPAKSKDWNSLFKVHQTQRRLGNDFGTEPHWLPVARNLPIARVWSICIHHAAISPGSGHVLMHVTSERIRPTAISPGSGHVLMHPPRQLLWYKSIMRLLSTGRGWRALSIAHEGWAG
jgi:hypothetical protein